MSRSRDMAQLIEAVCRLEGWTARQARRNGHWRIKGPRGQLVFAALTPSDARAVRNTRALLRRAGAEV